MSDFNIGDRVVFARNPHRYVIGPYNPLQGTRHACVGTIDRVETNRVHVQWDNGAQNGYSLNSLDLYEKFIDVEVPTLATILGEK